MRSLYHFPICPFSRQVRVILRENGYDFKLTKEDFWLRSPEFLSLSPSAELPVLLEPNGQIISDIFVIIEYLWSEMCDDRFIVQDISEKCEIRRMISWFNRKFYREVTKYILDEKMVRLFQKNGSPQTHIIRAATKNLHHHLLYTASLIEKNGFIASERMSIADLVVASHISVLDYFNEIMWDNYPTVKDWYMLIKCRPSFRNLLHDRIMGFIPPKHYDELDI